MEVFYYPKMTNHSDTATAAASIRYMLCDHPETIIEHAINTFGANVHTRSTHLIKESFVYLRSFLNKDPELQLCASYVFGADAESYLFRKDGGFILLNKSGSVHTLWVSSILQNSAFLLKKYVDVCAHIVSNTNVQHMVYKSYEYLLEPVEMLTKFVDIPIKIAYPFLDEAKIAHFMESDRERLMLFTGAPGTGKTNLLKLLINKYKNITFVILTSNFLTDHICSSEFISKMQKEKNLVYLIEEGEAFLLSRKESPNPLASFLLESSDGLLGHTLQNKYIITTNLLTKNIDAAFLRKGRLSYCEEFRYLNRQEASAVCDFLGKSKDGLEKETSLADIFNQEDNNAKSLEIKKRRIGF